MRFLILLLFTLFSFLSPAISTQNNDKASCSSSLSSDVSSYTEDMLIKYQLELANFYKKIANLQNRCETSFQNIWLEEVKNFCRILEDTMNLYSKIHSDNIFDLHNLETAFIYHSEMLEFLQLKSKIIDLSKKKLLPLIEGKLSRLYSIYCINHRKVALEEKKEWENILDKFRMQRSIIFQKDLLSYQNHRTDTILPKETTIEDKYQEAVKYYLSLTQRQKEKLTDNELYRLFGINFCDIERFIEELELDTEEKENHLNDPALNIVPINQENLETPVNPLAIHTDQIYLEHSYLQTRVYPQTPNQRSVDHFTDFTTPIFQNLQSQTPDTKEKSQLNFIQQNIQNSRNTFFSCFIQKPFKKFRFSKLNLFKKKKKN